MLATKISTANLRNATGCARAYLGIQNWQQAIYLGTGGGFCR